MEFIDDFKFGIFKSEVREHIQSALLYIHLSLKSSLFNSCWYSGPISTCPLELTLRSVFSNLIHEEFLYRIKFLVKRHCCNTNIPPQTDWDCRLNDRGEPEEPLKSHSDSVMDRKYPGDRLTRTNFITPPRLLFRTTLILLAVTPDDHLWIEAGGFLEHNIKLHNLDEE